MNTLVKETAFFFVLIGALTNGAVLTPQTKEPTETVVPSEDPVPLPPMPRPFWGNKEPPRRNPAELSHPDSPHRAPYRVPLKVHFNGPLWNHPPDVHLDHATVSELKPNRVPPKVDIREPLLNHPPLKHLEHAPLPKSARRPIPAFQSAFNNAFTLSRRQEWGEANGHDSSYTDRSHMVHDRTVGDKGIMALKDNVLHACFINHYFEPFVLPYPQRLFYTHSLPATVIESVDEAEQFRNCVGSIVANHCRNVKSFWLDVELFFTFGHECQNQNRPVLLDAGNTENGDEYPIPIPLEPKERLEPIMNKFQSPQKQDNTDDHIHAKHSQRASNPEAKLKTPPLRKTMEISERKFSAGVEKSPFSDKSSSIANPPKKTPHP